MKELFASKFVAMKLVCYNKISDILISCDGFMYRNNFFRNENLQKKNCLQMSAKN